MTEHEVSRRTAETAGTPSPDDRPSEPVVLTGASLTIADVEAVARHGRPVALDDGARARIVEARQVIERLVAAGEIVYGVTTGFGALATTFIEPADTARLQENLLVSHAVGVGAPLPDDVVRAMLLLRANTLALGHSGCRPEVVDRLLDLLNLRIHPIVPEQGSVGASGDLAPLAHLALPLIGRGEVTLNGRRMPALLALRETGLEPLQLQAKEGLALLNGTQLMTAIGALFLADAERLARTANVAAAISVEALLGTDVAFAEAYQLARPHPGQVEVAAQLRYLLRDSTLMAGHHPHTHKVQDPYSIRCVPQVHGAVLDALNHVRRVLDIELNAATDNPLVFPQGGAADADAAATGGGLVISGGNFHGEPIALALDFGRLAVAELGSISERRTALLLDGRLNGGLPPFLTQQGGLNSGLMLVQYTAAALVSENKVLAHPASVDSIPTSANQEDHVSMGATAALLCQRVLANVEQVIAIEILCAVQALDLRLAATGDTNASRAEVARGADLASGEDVTPGHSVAQGEDVTRGDSLAQGDGLAPGAGVASARERVRARIAHLDGDRELGPDLAAALELVRSGSLVDLVA